MPPSLPQSEESIVTGERLRLLSWGFYISGGIGAFFASFLLIYAFFFGAMSFIPEQEWNSGQPKGELHQSDQNDTGSQIESRERSDGPPVIVFRIFAIGMVFATLVGWAFSGLTIYAGYCIRQRKRRIFTNIMAAYNLIWVPYGTLLGVLTFIVINSQEAMRQYENGNS